MNKLINYINEKKLIRINRKIENLEEQLMYLVVEVLPSTGKFDNEESGRLTPKLLNLYYKRRKILKNVEALT